MATGTAVDGRLETRTAGIGTLPLLRGALTIGFALLTWAGARLSVPLPFTPVPGTLQTLAVLLAGAVLGPRLGAASQALYIGLGLAGLPVFALPGSGPLYLLGPTGGYLVGFVGAAWVTGRLLRSPAGRGVPGSAAAFLAGTSVLYACGILWLTLVFGGDFGRAVRLGLVPFALFDLVKVALATAVHVTGRRFLGARTGT